MPETLKSWCHLKWTVNHFCLCYMYIVYKEDFLLYKEENYFDFFPTLHWYLLVLKRLSTIIDVVAEYGYSTWISVQTIFEINWNLWLNIQFCPVNPTLLTLSFSLPLEIDCRAALYGFFVPFLISLQYEQAKQLTKKKKIWSFRLKLIGCSNMAEIE